MTFKHGDLVRRVHGAGGGWNEWCEFCAGLKISSTHPVRVDLSRLDRFKLRHGEDFIGGSIDAHWSREFFERVLEPKPLEDYL